MILSAILAALAGFLLGLFGVGFLAAQILEAARGSREGAAAMAGFFFFGPFGGVAGALLGVGLVLRFAGGSQTWGKGLLVAAAACLAIVGVVLALSAAPDTPSARYSYVIEFELEVPTTILADIDIPGPNAMWGAAGADLDDKPISQFFEKSCSAGLCILPGSVAAAGPMYNFRIAAHLGQKQYRFSLDLPASIDGPIDWSTWRAVDNARLRWRAVKRL